MSKLVLARHGESFWNLSNRFTGWTDVPLTETGIREAQQLAIHCQQFKYSAAFTSELIRAQATLVIILAKQSQTSIFQHEEDLLYSKWLAHSNPFGENEIPIYTSSSLNERYYGELQGMNKLEAESKYGKDQVVAWRRGYKDTPPKGESLEEAHSRMHTYFVSHILARVIRGETILVVAHGNTLRAAIKHLENISDKNISSVNLPEAKPLVYEYSNDNFIRIEGDYDLTRPLR
jgi:2,3-bisphosphoglycerate-dependent phosphoglycerate mutase